MSLAISAFFISGLKQVPVCKETCYVKVLSLQMMRVHVTGHFFFL